MLKFNWFNLQKEIREIELLSDEVEKATRFQLVYIIEDKVNEYNEHISNYEYAQKKQEIINRGVVFVPQSKPSSVKAKWTKLFAVSVSSNEKREIGFDHFKWHIFSFEKVYAYTNSKARQAFNKCKKEKMYVFYQNKDEAYLVENAQLLKSTDFDSDYDIYIFDMIKKWTYVHTHELQCGPYFYQVK